MASVLQGLTWEDLQHLPETAGRTELVHGELVTSPTPSAETYAAGGALTSETLPCLELDPADVY